MRVRDGELGWQMVYTGVKEIIIHNATGISMHRHWWGCFSIYYYRKESKLLSITHTGLAEKDSLQAEWLRTQVPGLGCLRSYPRSALWI